MPIYLFILAVTPRYVWSEGLYLEGVSIVGAEKNAYLSLDGIKVVVSEGEIVGTWQVDQIIHKAVLLSSKNGIQTTLALHARLATEVDTNTAPEENIDEQPHLSIPQQPVIADEAIPPEHHKVHTPFGDFVVKDAESKKEAVISAMQPLEIPANGEIPDGYRKISTPFGEFLIEDKNAGYD